MSKIALSGNASGTGTLTIAAPNTNTDRTLTLPDRSGTVATTDSTGDAPMYSARAWVNFNGTGTVAIRASGNVSSITDNGTGDYTVNFATALPDANYVICGSAAGNTTNMWSTTPADVTTARTTTAARIATTVQNGVAGVDSTVVNIAVFR